MTKVKRQIIKIDEAKCNGCGLCVPSCKEGALKIIDGKAKLVSEIYCDGLGDCLGECPEGALTIEEKEVEAFDEKAVEKHMNEKKPETKENLPCGCPGTMSKTIERKPCASTNVRQESQLSQWPIQLTLIPVNAPYLKNSDLVLLADCTALAYADVQHDFIKGRAIAIACPKLDQVEPYIEKLTQMIKINNFKSIEVVMMEVPCCSGLERIVQRAVELSGVDLKLKKTIISIEGKIL
ncbi:MAG: 4Fe-4S binding protein [Pseudomonadota bacterium]